MSDPTIVAANDEFTDARESVNRALTAADSGVRRALTSVRNAKAQIESLRNAALDDAVVITGANNLLSRVPFYDTAAVDARDDTVDAQLVRLSRAIADLNSAIDNL
ncbi:hypothetical protein MMPV_004659 [Pyropia vietnamensis]